MSQTKQTSDSNDETSNAPSNTPARKNNAVSWIAIFSLALLGALGVGGYGYLEHRLTQIQGTETSATQSNTIDTDMLNDLHAEITALQETMRQLEASQFEQKETLNIDIITNGVTEKIDAIDSIAQSLQEEVSAQQGIIEQLQDTFSKQTRQQKTDAFAPVMRALLQLRLNVYDEKKAQKSLTQLVKALDGLPVTPDTLQLRAALSEAIAQLKTTLEMPLLPREILRKNLKDALALLKEQNTPTPEQKSNTKNAEKEEPASITRALSHWFGGHVTIESNERAEQNALYEKLHKHWKNDALMAASRLIKTLDTPSEPLQKWQADAQHFHQSRTYLKRITDSITQLTQNQD